jgi:hypothetical protein
MFGAAREQTSITIDLDDVAEFDQELAEAIAENTRRYVQVCWSFVVNQDPVESTSICRSCIRVKGLPIQIRIHFNKI